MKTTIERNRRIMIMAGGTGGHVFPGLTVAQRLTLQGWDVRWLGTRDRIEAELVPKYGIKMEFIRIRGFRNGGIRIKLMAPFNILRATKQARCIMHIWRPDVVLGMGGYVAGPGGLAAWSCGIPIVLHEQNSIVGMTNRYLAKIANRRLQAFYNAFPSSSGVVEVVGNPVRDEIIALSSPEKRLRNRYGPIRVLVIGGSQGAKVLNHTMPWVASNLSGTVTLWHQVGKGALHEVNHIYTILGETNHRVVEFIDDMATAYDWADIVVCRSGALTVSELAVAGLPALFVPLIQKDHHQYWNARRLEERGAAKIIEQSEFTVLRVSHFISSLDRSTLLSMAKRARAEAIIDATDRMIRALEEVVMGTH